MKSTTSTSGRLRIQNSLALATLFTVILILIFQWPSKVTAAESLLAGRVTSSTGEALGGIPVRANRGTITVSVYTNSRGEYSYPEWSQVKAGPYSISVVLPDFEHVTQSVELSAGNTARLDLQLIARTPSVEDVTASEIVAALPGTNEQKHLVIQCDNCHSLQHAFRVPRDKEGWKQIITRMAGEVRVNRDTPNSRAYDQKQYLEPLSEYLAMIRGPGSSSDLPFKLRERPTSDASTSLVVTEYDIPRGGGREHIIRGDRRAAWPHDILLDMDGRYAYYTDHYSYNLGRLDRRTGEVKEFPYEVLEGMGRVGGMVAQAQLRAGNPGGGAHDMLWDPDGNVVFGMGGGILVFNTKTETFKPYATGDNMFGLDGEGNVWYLDDILHKLDPKTGAITDIDIPKNVDGVTYDMETDKQGRSFMNMFRESSIGMYNPATERFEAIPTPTHGSGPRRGDVDDQGRIWMGLYWAGRVGMLDPDTKQITEFNLVPGYAPYGPPFVSAYSVAVDDKNQFAWTNDFNSRRTYKIDIRTGESTEYYMPLPYEVRDLTVEDNAPRPTVWIPSYRPPSRMVKIELY
jgi:virginiamycin B lyase